MTAQNTLTVRLKKSKASPNPMILLSATPRRAKANVYPRESIKLSVEKKSGVRIPASNRLNSAQGSTVVIARSEKQAHTNAMPKKIPVVLTNGEDDFLAFKSC